MDTEYEDWTVLVPEETKQSTSPMAKKSSSKKVTMLDQIEEINSRQDNNGLKRKSKLTAEEMGSIMFPNAQTSGKNG